MAEQFNPEQIQQVIENGIAQAQELMNDPTKVDQLLQQLQQKIKELPAGAGEALANIPLMASMVKSYVSKEYTAVSPKVVIALVSAFLYLVKSKDIIPDYIPVVGLADDLAVVAIALALCKPELEAYSQWRDSGAPQQL
jgi:uncharacterized membrane protein YkvA (DUF1232 family)